MKNRMFEKIKFFKANFPEYWMDMQNSEHGLDETMSNPYHVEGNVLSHTMAVCSHVQKSEDIVQWAALLHDIGKPDCRMITDKGRVAFRNHGQYGIYKALEVLKAADVPKDDILMILQLIARHQDLYTEGTKNYETSEDEMFYYYLRQVANADATGAIPEEFHKDGNAETIKIETPVLNNNKNIVVLIGVPGSGKSSLSEYEDYSKISRDDTMVKYANAHKGEEMNYSECWKYCEENNLHKEVDKVLKNTFDFYVRNGHNIVIDMTNMSRKSRNKWLQIKDYNKIAHLVISDFKTIVSRNDNREGKFVSMGVIKNFMKSLVWPELNQFDKVIVEYN